LIKSQLLYNSYEYTDVISTISVNDDGYAKLKKPLGHYEIKAEGYMPVKKNRIPIATSLLLLLCSILLSPPFSSNAEAITPTPAKEVTVVGQIIPVKNIGANAGLGATSPTYEASINLFPIVFMMKMEWSIPWNSPMQP
jgi:hypothetical protein